MPVEPTSRVRRTSDDFVAVPVDGELVFMNVLEDRIHSLEGIGQRVWELLDGDGDGNGDGDGWVELGPVVEALCEEFEVDASTCQRDVAVLLEELRGSGLVELQGEPALGT